MSAMSARIAAAQAGGRWLPEFDHWLLVAPFRTSWAPQGMSGSQVTATGLRDLWSHPLAVLAGLAVISAAVRALSPKSVRARLRHWLLPTLSTLPGRGRRPLATATVLGRGLMGKDKWLGGELGTDGCAYSVPGSATQVLKVDVATQEVTTFGGPFPGKFKWLRGIRAADGCIYGVPANADTVLKIDPLTQSVTTLGGPFPGNWKWHGAVLAPADGAIYGIPCNAEEVLKIVPGGAITTLRRSDRGGGPLVGQQKWYGGLLGVDGCIYGIPNCAHGVLKVDPRTQEVSTFGGADLPDTPFGDQKYRWHGGVAHPNGCIYGVPSHADCVLKIDPAAQSVTTFGGPIPNGSYRPNGKYKYGGAVIGSNGAIYCLPSDADQVLKVNPVTEEATLIGPAFDDCHNKWQNGYLASDGHVYAIPCNAEAVLRICCRTDEVTTIPITDGFQKGYEKWEGGVVGGDGCMYCVPQASKTVLKITPAP